MNWIEASLILFGGLVVLMGLGLQVAFAFLAIGRASLDGVIRHTDVGAAQQRNRRQHRRRIAGRHRNIGRIREQQVIDAFRCAS